MTIKLSNSVASSLKHLRFWLSFVLFLSFLSPSFSQTEKQKEDIVVPHHKYFEGHNPTKAMWMSAALPGLGQYYNRKFWKIPIVYAGFSGLAFAVITSKQKYISYRDAYSIRLSLADGETTDNVLVNSLPESTLLSGREYYQSNLERSYILIGAFYLLQIIDATIDAHFYDYDINDNLSIGIDPIIYQDRNQIYAAPGLKLHWTMGKP